MVPVWPAVLWMEMRLGALRVPRRQWPASLIVPVWPAVLWMELRLGALKRWQQRRLLEAEINSSRRQRLADTG